MKASLVYFLKEETTFFLSFLCVINHLTSTQLGLKKNDTTLQYWLSQTDDPEDKALLKSFIILCIAEINAYNAQDLLPEEWLALLANWNM